MGANGSAYEEEGEAPTVMKGVRLTKNVLNRMRGASSTGSSQSPPTFSTQTASFPQPTLSIQTASSPQPQLSIQTASSPQPQLSIQAASSPLAQPSTQITSSQMPQPSTQTTSLPQPQLSTKATSPPLPQPSTLTEPPPPPQPSTQTTSLPQPQLSTKTTSPPLPQPSTLTEPTPPPQPSTQTTSLPQPQLSTKTTSPPLPQPSTPTTPPPLPQPSTPTTTPPLPNPSTQTTSPPLTLSAPGEPLPPSMELASPSPPSSPVEYTPPTSPVSVEADPLLPASPVDLASPPLCLDASQKESYKSISQGQELQRGPEHTNLTQHEATQGVALDNGQTQVGEISAERNLDQSDLKDLASAQDHQLWAHLYAHQLEQRMIQLKKQDALYREQVAKLELKGKKFYSTITENYQKASQEFSAKFRHYQRNPVCAELQSEILKCYRENAEQTLSCSRIASLYLQCVREARQEPVMPEMQRQPLCQLYFKSSLLMSEFKVLLDSLLSIKISQRGLFT